MDCEIDSDITAGEAYFNNVKRFLAEEIPFGGLEMRLVREPLEAPARLVLTEDERKRTLDYQTGEPIKRPVRFGYDYLLTYVVKKVPKDRELPEHPIGDANRNFDDLDKFEKALKRQVGNILARLLALYPGKITIILDEEQKEVNSELIAELDGNAKARIAYLSTSRRSPSQPEQAASPQRAMKIL